jgi:hypothetical protein
MQSYRTKHERNQAVTADVLRMNGLSIYRNVRKHIETKAGVIAITENQCITGDSALELLTPIINLKVTKSVMP